MASSEKAAPPVTIDVVSDVVCPWCYLGKRRLEAALAEVPEIPVEIRWRPFQLDSTIPPDGVPREEYIARKFGGQSGYQAMQDRLVEAGREEGVEYRFDLIRRSPNTIDAHRLLRWTAAIDKQNEASERLFRLYFIEGVDVGQHEVLADVAAELGMDRAQTLARLASDEDRLTVQQEIAEAQRIGVTGVPTFILIGRYGLVGAQPKDALVMAIRKVADEMKSAAA